jgi:Trehalose utilisation
MMAGLASLAASLYIRAMTPLRRPFAWSAAVVLALIACSIPLRAAETPKPIRALLIAGGCCHDYAMQKDILKQGIEARANVVVDVRYTADQSTHPPLPILGNPEYAQGYDLVIHDECGADISDPKLVEGVLKPHRDGIPGVNLHCAMHCYRIGNPNDPVTLGTPHGYWFEYLGLQSSGHGPQLPIAIHYVDTENPIAKGLSDWTTINEEHYNNVHIFATAHAIAQGKQTIKRRDGTDQTNEYVVAWTNTYGPNKTRVFSTTIGHNNVTVGDPRYLDLVTHGVLWATGHLAEDGSPAPGYGPAGK